MTTATTTRIAARVVDAVKVYGVGDTAVRALDGVSVDFPAGRFTAIMGPSGSGKSTLMHCAPDSTRSARAPRTSATRYSAPRRPAPHTAAPRTRRLRLPGLQPDPDADRRGEHHPAPGPLRIQGDREWIDALVDVVGLRDGPPPPLGTLRRPAATRRRGKGVRGRPEVVFADEPTGNLDSRSGGEVLGLLRRAVRQTDRTVVMVTHDR